MKKRIISLKPISFWLIYASVIIVAVVLDQLSKYYMGLAAGGVEGWSKQIFPNCDWLCWHWTLNDGASFGSFAGIEKRNILFFVMTVIGLPVFVYMLYRSRTRSIWGQIAFAFIIGGTLGNAIDRLFFAEDGFFTGKVRDFIGVTWFATFNVADSFLVVGVILALLAIVFFDHDSLLNTILDDRRTKQTSTADNGIPTKELPTKEAVDSITDNKDSIENTKQYDENHTDIE